MLIRKSPDLRYSDITPRSVYMNRRDFLAAMGIGAAGVAAAGSFGAVRAMASPTGSVPVPLKGVVKSSYTVPDKVTPVEDVTHYNNYYEFGTDKEDPAKNSGNFSTANWSVAVSGEVNKPRTFTMDEIMKLAPLEERIYRHRCVEAWSIVVPWIGYSFSTLAKLVEPTQSARYVAFQTYYDSKQMPLGRYAGIDLPYVEGLRIDEAMHPLTLLCVGMFDETLPNQDGAPVRMVIPWKYGFKGIKSIVKIRFVKDQPPTTWNIANAHEYGFYSNVNPHVDHPRWSQATERRLGELFRRPTLMYNGYDQVASLYNGMDLRKYY